MKIFHIDNINFSGQRKDRNTIDQLQKENPYALNVINQRNIKDSIENLSEVHTEDNINFLLNVSDHLKYGTNIANGNYPFHDWRKLLNDAALKAYQSSDSNVQDNLAARLKSSNGKFPLSDEENTIVKLRDEILKNVDSKQLNLITNENVKNLINNLDNFIVSSEVTIQQKLYILKRLSYFMSKAYKINFQLEDKKTQALAEILNDIVIDTPNSKIPNIKAVNQLGHGMCAAISICRKNLAYEDKMNYVDMVLSELDNNDYIEVYDITKLGTHTKVKLPKAVIDYDYALKKGYRIVDASSLNWMNVANASAYDNEQLGEFIAFDKAFFDNYSDSHWFPNLEESLQPLQNYYRALLKANDILKNWKKHSLKDKYTERLNKEEEPNNIKMIKENNDSIKVLLSEILPNEDSNSINMLSRQLSTLEVANLKEKQAITDYRQDFTYLPNESIKAKLEKMKAFLSVYATVNNPKILDKNISEIYELLTANNKIQMSTKNNNSLSKRISHYEDLYKAASAFRTQLIMGLDVPDILNNNMRSFNIKDRESLIRDNIDVILTSLKDDTISKELESALLNNIENAYNREDLIELLSYCKDIMDNDLYDVLNSLYSRILAPSLPDLLAVQYEDIKTQINNKEVPQKQLEQLADSLKTKHNVTSINASLDDCISELRNPNCTKDTYEYLYNLIGNKSHLEDFKKYYEGFIDLIINKPQENEYLIEQFMAVNNLDKDASYQDVLNVISDIGSQFNNISLYTTNIQQALTLVDNNKNVLNIVTPKENVLKAFENKNLVISNKDLSMLQDKFTKIDNALRTSPNKITIKDLPKELTTFSKHEQQVLALIEDNLNLWYNTVTRDFNEVHNLLKEPLNELGRQVGVKTGKMWVREGSSGLAADQEVKIIERMTDRPYYIENDIMKAINTIKNSAYSGISSSSVSSKEVAMHAQYIADVKPILINGQDGPIVKDAILHDNTWGALEHENVWIDDDGLQRTDYRRLYGGDLGYITDDKYRNGNLVENLLGKSGEHYSSIIPNKQYKRLVGSKKDSTYKFPLISDIITPGIHPKAEHYVRTIRDNILVSPTSHFSQLENLASKMTRAELLNKFKMLDDLGKNVNDKYLKLENKILDEGSFSKKIMTKDDYDKYVDKDIKLLFEKLASIRSYNEEISSQIDLNAYNSIESLNTLNKKIKSIAQNNFDYTFGKSLDIIKVGKIASLAEISKILDDIFSSNKIVIQDNVKKEIIDSLSTIDNSKFDGSLTNTIDLMTNSFVNSFNAKTPNFKNKISEAENLKSLITDILHKNMEINIEDVKDFNIYNSHLNAIANFIDDKFDPVNDAEFVNVFRNIQNMTFEEYKTSILPKVSDVYLGINNITGYDMFKRFKAQDEIVQNDIFDLIYSNDVESLFSKSKTTPSYLYKKFQKIENGAHYVKNKRTFDDIYTDYMYSLKSLNMQNNFKTIQDSVFKQYKLSPAYPKVEYINKESEEAMAQNLYSDIASSVETISVCKKMINSITLLKNLNKYLSKLEKNAVLSDVQKRHVDKVLREFLNTYKDDPSVASANELTQKILSLPNNTKVKAYNAMLSILHDEFFVKAGDSDIDSYNTKIKDELNVITQRRLDYVRNIVEPQYQSKANELFLKWLGAYIKSPDNSINLFITFNDYAEKHAINKKPENILKQYLLSLAKDSPHDDSKVSRSQNLYKESLEALLQLSNVVTLQQILIKCAKEANINMVIDKFKDVKMELTDGSFISLNSTQGLNLLIVELLNSNVGNFDSILSCVKQLGLSNYIVDLISADEPYKNLTHSYKHIKRIQNGVNKQEKIINDEFKNLENIQTKNVAFAEIQSFIDNLDVKLQRVGQKEISEFIISYLESTLEELKQYPNCNRLEYLKSVIGSIPQEMVTIAQKYCYKDIAVINNYKTKVKLLESLALNPDTESYDKAQKFIDSVNKAATENS